MVISNMQILSSFGSLYLIAWPPLMSQLFSAFNVTNFSLLTIPGVDLNCINPVGFYRMYYFTTLAPVVFVLMLLIVLGIARMIVCHIGALKAKQVKELDIKTITCLC